MKITELLNPVEKQEMYFVENTERSIEEGDNRVCYDVIKKGEHVGYVDFLPGDVLPKNCIEIYIEVLPNFRGLGLSKEIYKSIPEEIKPDKLYAVVDIDNKASIALHNSLGFKRVKVIKDVIKGKEKTFNVYVV